MGAFFPKLCLWRRSLCSNLGGIGVEKLYRATLTLLMKTLPTPLPSATMLGTQINPVTVAKDLGVYTDCHLNFNELITKLPLTVCLN